MRVQLSQYKEEKMNKVSCIIITVLLISFFTGCSKNNPPVMDGITMSPADSIFTGGTLQLTADAVDEDNDDLTYAWSASGGSVSPMTGQTIDWTAPVDTGHYTITVKVEDSEDSARFMDTIKVYSSLLTYSGKFTTPVGIYDSVLMFIGAITIAGAGDKAITDSIELTVDVTHNNPGYLVMYLVTPDDRYCIPWDGNYAGGQQSIMISGFAIPPLPVNGDWELYVGVYGGGGNGTVNSWSIKLFSHMTL
jgi:hypothetical protein